ncbi:hypothetical protein JCM10212_001156 [Sporobolomyces blumeae]
MSRLLRKRYPHLEPSLAVDTLVIGGGVVGLAIAERLTKAFADKTTFLVERHGQAGQETSSRNSEVIHSGIYYPAASLKTRLCIRGRDLVYSRCRERSIPHRQTGKLVLASSRDQEGYLKSLYDKARRIKRDKVGEVPLEWLTGEEVRELEPDVGDGIVAALRSPMTGIVSSHALMDDLEKEITESETGEVVYGTRVVRIDRHVSKSGGGGKRGDGSEDGWVVQTVTDDGSGGEGERTAVLARSVVNAAGLNAHHILNQVLPNSEQLKLHYAKGSYFSYRGPGVSQVKHLLYPCPEGNASLSGLGTHLTMNLDGEIRFGPDVQWLDPPVDPETSEDVADFWQKHLAPDETRMQAAIREVKKFLPRVEADGFAPDYSGIRPKLSAKGETAVDFSITHPQPGFVSLQGIESPGLTASLAIAEHVEGIVRTEVWGLGKGTGRTVSEGGTLDGWA